MLLLAREFELVFANCEITLVQNFLDDVKAVLKFEANQIRLAIANLEKRRDLRGMRGNVGEFLIVKNRPHREGLIWLAKAVR